MGLTWDATFVKTFPGMLMAGQAVVALIGGIVNIFLGGGLSGFLGFLFWSTAFISGAFLLLHICNLMQMVEAKFPVFTKIQIGYIVIWSILYIIACILSFIGFAVSAIFGYIVIVLFVIDGFLRYRAYSSGSTVTNQANVEQGVHDPSNAAKAGAPKF